MRMLSDPLQTLSHRVLTVHWHSSPRLTSPDETESTRIGPATSSTSGRKGRSSGSPSRQSSEATDCRSRDWGQGISEPRDRLPLPGQSHFDRSPRYTLQQTPREPPSSFKFVAKNVLLGNPLPRNGARPPNHQLEFQGRNGPMKRVNPEGSIQDISFQIRYGPEDVTEAA